jgi:hypothetical protein
VSAPDIRKWLASFRTCHARVRLRCVQLANALLMCLCVYTADFLYGEGLTGMALDDFFALSRAELEVLATTPSSTLPSSPLLSGPASAAGDHTALVPDDAGEDNSAVDSRESLSPVSAASAAGSPSGLRSAGGRSPRKRVRPRASELSEEELRRRREMNNTAAERSRAKRRSAQDEMARRIKLLEDENNQLRAELRAMAVAIESLSRRDALRVLP